MGLQNIYENGSAGVAPAPGCDAVDQLWCCSIVVHCCRRRKWSLENQTVWLKWSRDDDWGEEEAARKVFASVSPSVGHLTMPRHAVPWTQNTWGCGELISRHTPLLYITAPRPWVLLCSQNTCSLVYPLHPPAATGKRRSIRQRNCHGHASHTHKHSRRKVRRIIIGHHYPKSTSALLLWNWQCPHIWRAFENDSWFPNSPQFKSLKHTFTLSQNHRQASKAQRPLPF